jgi:hypothetical protein
MAITEGRRPRGIFDLTLTKETQAPEVRLCYECAEKLSLSLNRPKFLFLYPTLVGRWRYSLMSNKLSRTLELAEQVHLLAQARNDSAILIGAYDALVRGDAASLGRLGSDKNQIESSFRAGIKTAQEQKSICLVRRAKESYAEWRAGKEWL